MIAAFSQLPPEDDDAKTGSIGSTDTQEDDNTETGSIGSTETQEDDNTYIPEDDKDKNTDIPDDNDDNIDTGSFRSTESFDTMTDITNDYGSLIEIIRLVNAEQAKVYNGKKRTTPTS
jgi:hypothetical protein